MQHLIMMMLHMFAAAAGKGSRQLAVRPGFEPWVCSFPSGGYYIFSFIFHAICRCAHACATATLSAARAVTRV